MLREVKTAGREGEGSLKALLQQKGASAHEIAQAVAGL